MAAGSPKVKVTWVKFELCAGYILNSLTDAHEFKMLMGGILTGCEIVFEIKGPGGPPTMKPEGPTSRFRGPGAKNGNA